MLIYDESPLLLEFLLSRKHCGLCRSVCCYISSGCHALLSCDVFACVGIHVSTWASVRLGFSACNIPWSTKLVLTAWGYLLQVEPKVQKLYDYIRERGTILPINDYNKELLMQDDVHKRVTESIRSGEFHVHTQFSTFSVGIATSQHGFPTPPWANVWHASHLRLQPRQSNMVMVTHEGS